MSRRIARLLMVSRLIRRWVFMAFALGFIVFAGSVLYECDRKVPVRVTVVRIESPRYIVFRVDSLGTLIRARVSQHDGLNLQEGERVTMDFRRQWLKEQLR